MISLKFSLSGRYFKDVCGEYKWSFEQYFTPRPFSSRTTSSFYLQIRNTLLKNNAKFSSNMFFLCLPYFKRNRNSYNTKFSEKIKLLYCMEPICFIHWSIYFICVHIKKTHFTIFKCTEIRFVIWERIIFPKIRFPKNKVKYECKKWFTMENFYLFKVFSWLK